MRIDRILYPVYNLGPKNRLAIWFNGCNFKCEGCSNKELWKINENKKINSKDIIDLIFKLKVKSITITGGEPFYQIKELFELLLNLKKNNINDIIIYTGYSIYKLFKILPFKFIDFLFKSDIVIIDSLYIESKKIKHNLIGSYNQKIIFFTKDEKKIIDLIEYINLNQTPDFFINNNKINSIGVNYIEKYSIALREIKKELNEFN